MPSPSPDTLEGEVLGLLVDIADEVLADALSGRQPELPDLDALPSEVHAELGAFVTLTVDGSLNGCIGNVVGREPLAYAVARLALAAAFDDPRLPALRPEQYERLTIEVSVLSAMVPVEADDRADLVAQLRPHVDGVAIRTGHRSGLFLPDVWAQLPEPHDFLDHLWHKAGLPTSVWPETIERFTTQRLHRPAGGRSGGEPRA